jgi:hypothetical protein
MEHVVLNRKNSLFVGNERVGRMTAVLVSLTSICRRHEVEPQMYLRQGVVYLPLVKMGELEQRLPDD